MKIFDKISDLQREYLNNSATMSIFDSLLASILSETESEYGFIGEIMHDANGAMFLQTHAITNIAWSPETNAFFEKNKAEGLKFYNLETLFGAVLKTGEILIANDAANHPSASGVPPGHPPLNRFLGVPLKANGQTIGMFGVSNRRSEYDARLVNATKPLIDTISSLMLSHRYQRELNAALSEIQFRHSALNRHSIVSETDINGRITYANDKFIEISGYSRDELIGSTHKIINSGFHSRTFFKDLWATISSGKTWHGDLKNKRKDGTFYWVRTTISPFINNKNEIERYFSIRTDITDEIKKQESLKLSEEMAQQANIAKSNFIASMSHELRTPLNAIIGYSEIMKIGVYGNLENQKQIEAITHIHSSGQHLLSMVNDVLNVSEFEIQSYSFSLEEYDMIEFTRSAAERFLPLTQKKNIDLTIHFDENVPNLIYSDRRAMTQVLNNIISNAIKATPENGKIRVSWKLSENDELLLSVSDSGEGMPQDLIDRVGQPFMHKENAFYAKGPNVGTGLGLFICKKLIEARGARLNIRSESGLGTTVTVTAPLSLFKRETAVRSQRK